MTDSKSNSNIKNNAKQTATNKTNSMHEFLSNKNSSRFVTNRQPVKLVSPGEKLRQPRRREATPMKQYLTASKEKIFANNREKNVPLGATYGLKTETKLREENTPKPTENATIKAQSNNVNLVTESKEMNKINISESDVSILQQGFYQVSHGGSALTTGRAFSNGAAVSISGKTGTAESYVEGGQEANNTNAVAYAPSDNPQIAVAVVFPHNTNLTNGVGPSIARDIINLYNQHHPMN